MKFLMILCLTSALLGAEAKCRELHRHLKAAVQPFDDQNCLMKGDRKKRTLKKNKCLNFGKRPFQSFKVFTHPRPHDPLQGSGCEVKVWDEPNCNGVSADYGHLYQQPAGCSTPTFENCTERHSARSAMLVCAKPVDHINPGKSKKVKGATSTKIIVILPTSYSTGQHSPETYLTTVTPTMVTTVTPPIVPSTTCWTITTTGSSVIYSTSKSTVVPVSTVTTTKTIVRTETMTETDLEWPADSLTRTFTMTTTATFDLGSDFPAVATSPIPFAGHGASRPRANSSIPFVYTLAAPSSLLQVALPESNAQLTPSMGVNATKLSNYGTLSTFAKSMTPSTSGTANAKVGNAHLSSVASAADLMK